MKLWHALVLGGSLALFGCSGGSGSNEPAPGPGPEPSANSGKPAPGSDFKVALITPGPISDAGWNAMAYDGLKAIETELGATVNNQEALGSKIKDSMRSYAQQGYKLVFGHGFEYNEPALEVAKDFPDTIFVSSSGAGTSANVGAFRFYLEQGFYLAGMAAGSMSKTGKVAMIGGPKVPSIESTFDGFEAGAKAANPKVVVIRSFTGSGEDVAKAKQATLAAIGQGADFVIHQANAAAQGVFEACKEKNVWAFGANLDQNGNPSGIVIGSATINAKPAFLKLAHAVKDGKFKGEVTLMGMSDEAIDYVWNPALMDKIPGDVIKKIMDARDQIRAGTLTVPKREF